MRFLVLGALLALAACGTSGGMQTPSGPGQLPPDVVPPPQVPTAPPPATGAIVYNCADGTQLMVDESTSSARVAIIGGPSMVLPSTDGGYSNGRYSLRGSRETADWQVGGGAPTSCRGS